MVESIHEANATEFFDNSDDSRSGYKKADENPLFLITHPIPPKNYMISEVDALEEMQETGDNGYL